ncbi:DUF6029 family protein [Pseudofulvibacter geojedonensis]|uniref:DUF6029 family protein n=1 Tax=Pseudofulvibacter geojedonensis TaxID=1123758 RepID=A0ABW3I1K7_9FLAO
MKKASLLFLAGMISCFAFSQEQDSTKTKKTNFKKFTDNLSGNFESNAQWYLNDKKTGEFDEDEHVRANSYLRLDYSFLKNFTVGIQAESYAPRPLLNYTELFNKRVAFAQFYANYRSEKLDITGGYFYEQFGSGLVLRAWEDRALGINNSLRGGKIKYSPTNYLNFTALYGKQRKGFSVANSDIFGGNAEFNAADIIKSDKLTDLTLGLSYVGKKEEYKTTNNDSNVPENVNAYSARLDISAGKFNIGGEYVHKSKDARLNKGSSPSFSEKRTFTGNAILFTTGFSQKGLGINYTFRRLENMRFFSERNFSNLGSNPTSQLTLNYIPGLTKQHDYTLTNIYVYQAQPGMSFLPGETFPIAAGEIGNQVDIFYKIKKGTKLGGKYGTKISLNYSYWAMLDAKNIDPNANPFFPTDDFTYEDEFLSFKKKLFTDFNIEIRKKWSRKLSSIFTYINTYYNQDILESKGNGSEVRAWIGIAESTYKLGKGRSARLELQHLSTNDDARNWVGGTAEYFFNSKFGIYINDSFNYEEGKNPENYNIHLFNVGGSFTKGATRVALNYGRQRGGLLCVGGVCRPVSKNTGLTLNLTTSF